MSEPAVHVEPIPDEEAVRMFEMSAERATEEWPVLLPYVERALEHAFGRLGPEDVLKGIQEHSIRPYVIVDARMPEVMGVICAELACYPQAKVMDVTLVSCEDLSRCKHLLWSLVGIAREQGCDQLELTGRPGWARALGLQPQAQTIVLRTESPHG